MNKSTLVSEIAKRTGLDPKDVTRVLEAALNVIRATVARGERVLLSGFGAFELVRRNPRTGRNPHTGEAVRIPARSVPSFRPGASFREEAGGRRKRRPAKPAAAARRRR